MLSDTWINNLSLYLWAECSMNAAYLEVVQVCLHILKELQDTVLQDVKETFQDIKLFIHQLEDSNEIKTRSVTLHIISDKVMRSGSVGLITKIMYNLMFSFIRTLTGRFSSDLTYEF